MPESCRPAAGARLRGRSLGVGAAPLIALVACALGAPRASAQAERPRRVVVVRASGEAWDRAALAEGIAGRLEARGIDAFAPPRASEASDERAALERASLAYANLHPGEARAALDDLVARADATGGAGVDRRMLIEALLLHAMADQALGDAGAADAAIARALAIDPALDPSPASYPPALRERVAALRTATDDRAASELRFVDVPEDATIVLDGAPLDRGARVARVAPGIHLVRVEAAGFAARGERLDVRAPAIDVRVALTPDPAATLRDPGPPDGRAPDRLREAARALGAELLLVDVVERDGARRAITFDAATSRQLTVSLAGAIDTPAAIADPLSSQLAAPRVIAEPTPPADASDDSTILWIAGGAAVAVVAAIVTVVAISASSSSEQAWTGRGTIDGW